MTQTRSHSSTAPRADTGHGAGPGRRLLRGTLSVVCGTALFAALTACAAGVPLVTGPPSAPTSPPVVVPSAEPTTSPTVEPEPSPAPTETPEPDPTPLTVSCTDLVPLDVLYSFNPNYGTDPNYSPAAGSEAAQMAAAGGLACGWINQSSSEEIEIAVAKLDDAALGAAYDKAMADSTPVPLFGMEGFFTFTPQYWLVARSTAFVEATDAQDLVNTALKNLPAS